MFQRSLCAWQHTDCFRARWLTAHHTDLSTITCRLLLDVSIVVSKLSDTSPRTNRWPLWKFVQSSNCWFSNFGQYVQRDKSSFIVPHIIVNRYYSRIYCIERSFTHSLTHVHAAWYVCIFHVQWGVYVFIILCTSNDIIDLITCKWIFTSTENISLSYTPTGTFSLQPRARDIERAIRSKI